ncbi:crossover junction endodeoxyribonuclease RuvC [Paenarthrobacter aurescens]|uniref:Crossover junction endodeoxyribonuclease RuvC n=1 Tax=Paenarthrobacter aurescens TaxID=43663 RepID=A0A4Y3NJQ4_PAEAU|nr:crossover junction endodeoxyribonuclease RuvC [Paenarthrobacter aurescens]UKA47987.1 crossover junction endodeoxyribonuclease RuvC [Arthrobacter sp. FW305-123]MDO6143741.1 crossover junction endodeoxyribonuclease RuvC [Paenarthrobacter aurescens]MDO6147589.1 crossover junction endodeoxyribonuclease RuvC [Paenarthrobacter aurescens]MDO6158832.1 crossover junction endodeoxyribonuclease RuvC [Paenarthrobacter aurescens]MDO6162816.1 crossover junction endodeoxyribonuclease RuvC [Paenarthrobacte
MTLRVLGVDPGLTRCGIGVVDIEKNRRATMVAVGVVGTSAELTLDKRLLVIAQAIDEWLDLHTPDVVAVERVFSQMNVSTVMGVAQASGVVIVAAARRGIPVALHTPSEVKAAVTGSGTSNKDAVTKLVTKILRLDAPPKPADAADALALALTHAWRAGSGMGSAGAANGSGGLTPAQKAWADAEAKARRKR